MLIKSIILRYMYSFYSFTAKYGRRQEITKSVTHNDASSIVWTLIDNSKLANQIARLVAIVVKIPTEQSSEKNEYSSVLISL